MLIEEVSYQSFASYLILIIVSCVIILVVLAIYKLSVRISNKKHRNSIEKNITLIYEELKKLNEKVDRLYNNDSDDFIEK